MGSGALLAALVVLWFVVLVPMVVTRGDSQTGKGELTSTGRTLQRRHRSTPVTSVDTERVAVDREALRTSGEYKVDVHKLRRRTLGGLVALTLLAFAGAFLLSAWVWPVQALLDLAVVGYVLVLRKVARRERLAARRAARAAVRDARMTASRPVRERRPEPVQQAVPVLPHPSLPLAPVHPLRPGRVVAARTAAPAGWQHSAVVGLDDDDIGFADIDEYQPRRVANG